MRQTNKIIENLKQITVVQYTESQSSNGVVLMVDVRWTVQWMGEDLWWKGLWNRCVLSLEWKRVAVIDGEGGDEGTGEHR